MANELKRLQAIRTQIAELSGEIASIENAALTAGEIKDKVEGTVDRWRGLVDSGWLGLNLARPGREIDFAMIESAVAGEPRKLVPLLAWLFGDQLKARLIESAAPFAEHGALPAAGRDDAIRELETKRRELEIEEERLVVTLEGQGVDITRRPDADPAIVLGIDEAA